jgi:hypothetical protein
VLKSYDQIQPSKLQTSATIQLQFEIISTKPFHLYIGRNRHLIYRSIFIVDNAGPVNKNIYALKDKRLTIVCKIFDHSGNVRYL